MLRRSKKGAVLKASFKQLARLMVNQAVAEGWLPKPTSCERCGAEERLFAHHDRYTEPLDVDWLCSRCHVDFHEGTFRNPVVPFEHEVGEKLLELGWHLYAGATLRADGSLRRSHAMPTLDEVSRGEALEIDRSSLPKTVLGDILDLRRGERQVKVRCVEADDDMLVLQRAD